jgi:DNA-binding transcriptional LysR family regulator
MDELGSISQRDITLTQLRALIAVADRQGFSAAAAAIGLTQSGVSQAVLALEAILGVPLLVRQREGVRPSAIGSEVLSDARSALQAIARIQERCAAVRGVRAGTLRVGSVPSAAARLLPRMLGRFRLQHPGVELVLLEGTDEEVVEWVARDAVHVGLSAHTAPGLDDVAIAEDEFKVVVARRHRLASRPHVRFTDLAGEAFLMSGGGCEPAIRAAFGQAGVTPDVLLTVRDMAALLAMVEAGLGVSMVPELALELRGRRLRALPLRPRAARTLRLLTRSGVEPTPARRAFVSLLPRA